MSYLLLHPCHDEIMKYILINFIYWFEIFIYQGFSRPQELNEQGSILECAIEAAANEIINLREKLNDWDSKVGDGDCGSTVSFLLRPDFIYLVAVYYSW